MVKTVFSALLTLLAFSAPGTALAHFAMVIPSDDIVTKDEPKEISLKVMFTHPFEGHYMEMERPAAFGVMTRETRRDLRDTLRQKKVRGSATWEAAYKIRKPGDHVFFVEPAPYWEPAEEKFIVHCTKVVVVALGLEDGWDAEAGLKAEIVPLTRPYGLWSGNVFQGVVKMGGKPVPGAVVEVEYYNEGGEVKAPADPYVTQVVKADGDGVFTYAMPRAGWWGFAALMEAGYRLKKGDAEYPVELGAVIWVKTRDMR